jgi:hypothetical protein
VQRIKAFGGMLADSDGFQCTYVKVAIGNGRADRDGLAARLLEERGYLRDSGFLADEMKLGAKASDLELEG